MKATLSMSALVELQKKRVHTLSPVMKRALRETMVLHRVANEHVVYNVSASTVYDEERLFAFLLYEKSQYQIRGMRCIQFM